MITNFLVTTASSHLHSSAAGMAVGGVFAFLGCFVIPLLRVQVRPKDEDLFRDD
jgi:hypothetical protein